MVEPSEAEEVTPGGFLLPQTAQEKPQQGIVVAVGTGRRDETSTIIAMDVKVDDKVLYAK
jgi:chaperonin GroES